MRRRIMMGLGEAIFIFGGAVVWVALDTLARSAASNELAQLLTVIVMALGPFLPLLKMIADRLGKTSETKKTGHSGGLLSDWTAALIAFPLAAFLLFVVDVLVVQAFRAGNSDGFLLLITDRKSTRLNSSHQ